MVITYHIIFYVHAGAPCGCRGPNAFPVQPPLSAAGMLSLASSPVEGALRDRLGRFYALSCATKYGAGQLAREGKTDAFRLFIFPAFSNSFQLFLSFHCCIGSLIQTGINAIQSSDGVRTLRGGAGCFLTRKAGETLASWRKEERTRATQRVGQPGRAGRTTAQPPPAPRGVGAREGACQALGLMHPACLALTTVRDGGDQNYLPPRRPRDALSGETICAGGQSHSGRLQKCPQEAKLQILLQIYGR